MRPSSRIVTPLDVLVLTTGLWFIAKLLRYAFPPLFDPLQTIYDVSSAELGIAFSAFMFCYAAMQFPSGVIRDRIGAVRVMVTGGAVAGVAALALVLEAGFLALVAVMLVIGLGTGLHKTVSVTLLARVYPTRTGRVLGIHDTIGGAAGLIAPITVIAFLAWVGWRPFFALAGAIGLTFAVLAGLRIPRRLPADGGPQPTEDRAPLLRPYLHLLRDGRFLLFLLMTVAVAFAYNGAVAFVPLYLVDVAGVSVATAGLIYSVFFAATFVQLVTGELSDRIGRLPIILVAVMTGLIGALALLVLTEPLLLAVAVAAWGIGGHGYRPARDAYMADLIPDRLAGGGIGMIRSVLMGAAALSPAVVGVLADYAGFRSGFAVLAGSLVIAVLATGLLLLTR